MVPYILNWCSESIFQQIPYKKSELQTRKCHSEQILLHYHDVGLQAGTPYIQPVRVNLKMLTYNIIKIFLQFWFHSCLREIKTFVISSQNFIYQTTLHILIKLCNGFYITVPLSNKCLCQEIWRAKKGRWAPDVSHQWAAMSLAHCSDCVLSSSSACFLAASCSAEDLKALSALNKKQKLLL
jgi:virulence-associated protein VapD